MSVCASMRLYAHAYGISMHQYVSMCISAHQYAPVKVSMHQYGSVSIRKSQYASCSAKQPNLIQMLWTETLLDINLEEENTWH